MIPVNRHILSNGLRVLHHEDRSTRMVALNLLYDVGSKDEDPDRTGFAHLFEHLMFGGSVHIPDFDTPLQEAGGENNAWTSNDVTNYYDVVPRQNVEIAFWLESDRMLALDFSEKSLAVQKQVVCEEFKQRNLNEPYGDIPLLVRPLAYRVHPYGWPTIGKELSHVEQADLEAVKRFFYRHYAPNNAILSVAGDISLEETVRLAEKWFGPVPRREVPVRKLSAEPRQREARFLEVARSVPQDAVVKAFHMCGRNDPDYYAFDLLSDLLSNGNSARLYRRLVVDRKLFSEVNAYISGDRDPGLFFVTGKLLPGTSPEAADEALRRELCELVRQPVGGEELQKVLNKVESNLLFSNLSYLNKATSLACYEWLGDAGRINDETARYRAVTPERLQACAAEAFSESNGSTLYYRRQP